MVLELENFSKIDKQIEVVENKWFERRVKINAIL